MTSPRMWLGSGIFGRRSAELSQHRHSGVRRRTRPGMTASGLARRNEESLGRQNRALNSTEADAVAVALAPAAHQKEVAVLPERALDAALQGRLPAPGRADLQQAAAR